VLSFSVSVTNNTIQGHSITYLNIIAIAPIQPTINNKIPQIRVINKYKSEGSVASFDFQLSLIVQTISGLIDANKPQITTNNSTRIIKYSTSKCVYKKNS
jgi:hypothetical protein